MKNKILKMTLVLALLAIIPSGSLWAESVWEEGDCDCVEGDPGWRYTFDADCDRDGLKNWEEDRNQDCDFQGNNETNWKTGGNDTDGDKIDDLFEYFNTDADHNAYLNYIRTGEGDLDESWFRCPETRPGVSDHYDCDGDGIVNARDEDSDGDNVPDTEENCNKDVEAVVAGPLFLEAGSDCIRAAYPYRWEETDPYNPDTDGDGLSDDIQEDLCPRAAGGDRYGTGLTNFNCVRTLCKPAVMAGLASDWDTDRDGRPDVQEDQDKDCQVDRQVSSLESDPYFIHSDAVATSGKMGGGIVTAGTLGSGDDSGDDSAPEKTTDAGRRGTPPAVSYSGTGDGVADGDDPCPLNDNPLCPGVCLQGGLKVKNLTSGLEQSRAETHSDEDEIPDLLEDTNKNCRYDAPLLGELVSNETNFESADTDGDAGSSGQRRLGTGYDHKDECPHIAYDAADPSTHYPKCLLSYCDESFGRLAFAIVAGNDTDDDGIDDIHENPLKDCLPHPEIHILNSDPLDADTDDDGFVDGEDQCVGVPNAEADMADITSCGYDYGMDAGPNNHCISNAGRVAWAGVNGLKDSDRDGIPNIQEDANQNCILDEFESNPFKRDTDGDGRRDDVDACVWDTDEFCTRRCVPNSYEPGRDSDGDGLDDDEEDPNQNCLYFGESGGADGEIEPWDTNPFLRDSDGDGINDKVDGCQGADDSLLFSRNNGGRPDVEDAEMECARAQCKASNGRTSGVLKDSDGDFIPDIIEDPNSDCEITAGTSETDRFNPDSDFDGIRDGDEDRNRNGRVDEGETDPTNDDTDNDGILDGIEDTNQNGRVDFGELDPKKADTDGDGIPDNIEDRNMNGVWDAGLAGAAVIATGPCTAEGNGGNPETSGYLIDSDLDGIPDNLEDLNLNGIFTDVGLRFLEDPEFDIGEAGVLEFGETHPCDSDTDNDGLQDGQEDKNKNGIFEPKNGETSPISPHTFGEPDLARVERRLGISGCSLIR